MENLDQDFKKLAKRSKMRRRLVTAGISVIGTAAVITGAVLARNLYIKQVSQQFYEQTNVYNEISSPNIINQWAGMSQGLLGGTYTQTAYKNLDGIPVVLGNSSANYGQTFGTQPAVSNSPFVSSFSDVGASTDFQGGQKIPNFYRPGYSIGQEFFDKAGTPLPEEIKTLKKLPNHLVEVAVTFDKAYTYQQIKQMMPKNLMLNWLWLGIDPNSSGMSTPLLGISTTVDTYDKGTPEVDAKGNQKVVDNRINGINMTINSDVTGLTDSMYQDFVAALKRARTFPELQMLYQVGVNTQDDKALSPYNYALVQVEKYPTLDQAKFAGVILTGKSENFAQLEGKNWLVASSIGASTENLPYLTPTD